VNGGWIDSRLGSTSNPSLPEGSTSAFLVQRWAQCSRAILQGQCMSDESCTGQCTTRGDWDVEVLIERASRANCPVNGIAAPNVRVWDGVQLQSAQGLCFCGASFGVFVLTGAVFPARAAVVKSLKDGQVIHLTRACTW